jgi:hypothetical protein
LRFYSPHNNYRGAKGKSNVDTISSNFGHWVRGDTERIFDMYGVFPSSARKWHRRWLTEPGWRPSNPTPYCMAEETSSDQEEQQIADQTPPEI